ncbi:MAG: alpha/beta hydrolase, partial [Boseongicola sp.]|nr:alpha/beta hydrolase [Boseongicola sp.]
SLGGRGVVLALAEIASRYPEERVGHVVLLAPDMDFEIFVRLWPRISRIAEGFTIYVSDEDRPLAVSAQLHGYQRLGQAGNDVSSLDGVEVIDVSMLPDVDASGHLYHIHDARVGDDLNLLLNQRLAANERAGLTVTGTNTWSILQN